MIYINDILISASMKAKTAKTDLKIYIFMGKNGVSIKTRSTDAENGCQHIIIIAVWAEIFNTRLSC